MIRKPSKAKIITLICFIFVFVLLMVFLFADGNLQGLLALLEEDVDADMVQDELIEEFGIRGYITIAILSMLQVVIPFLPAEPVQVLGGLAFGFFRALACCTIGVFLGNTVIYILYKIFGNRLKAYFDKNIHIDFEKTGANVQLAIVIFILYFLPAIPYGMICFLAATMKMKYPRYITITLLGSIPSICIGVALGHVAVATSWILSVGIFALLVILLAIMAKKRQLIFDKINAFISKAKEPYSSKTVVRKCNRFILNIVFLVSKIIFFFKGVKVKYTWNVKNIDTPSIVLSNHGSFWDFIYTGTLIRKKPINFIVNRMYFYNKYLAWLTKRLGCFPKSMFTADLDSAKNCFRALKSGGVLAMMPEARLSTVGRFEDIQDGTSAFLKSAKATVYVVKLRGDYLARPKWAKKMRRGSHIEATLDVLFTKEELEELSVSEIKARMEGALYYDEYAWLNEHPEFKYKTRHLAEGLENILTRCPHCGARYSMKTKKRRLWCEECGQPAILDDRYAFVDNSPFENIASWYDWQVDMLRQEIAKDEGWSISSDVALYHASLDGKKFLRLAGNGKCVFNREGLTYTGTTDGEAITKHFPINEIYRLLFGAGEDFELYEGKELYYFVPTERRSCVDWYIASKLLKEEFSKSLEGHLINEK